MSSTVRVAMAQYPLERMRSWEAYCEKIARWVAQAAAEGAELVVFPEYAGMELLSIADCRTHSDRRSSDRHTLGPLPVNLEDRRHGPDLNWESAAIQQFVPAYLALHADLSARNGVYVLAGSLALAKPDGTLRNTAFFFSPEEGVGWQEKIIPTRWEREVWGIRGGDEVRVFETRFGPIGVAICYDVEFPLIARRQAEAEAQIILAPCCTDSLRGYHRVRIGARARALENQAYVLQAPLVGRAPWLLAVGDNVGSAGAYVAPDIGPREDGVIVQGPFDLPQWVFADLDLAALRRIRGSRPIANVDEWSLHLRIGPAVEGRFQSVA